MNIHGMSEKNIFRLHWIVAGFVAVFSVSACSDSGNGSETQAQKSMPDTSAAMSQQEAADTSMAVEEAAMSESAGMASSSAMTEAPAAAAEETMQAPAMTEAPAAAMEETTQAPAMTEETATAAVEEQAAAATQVAEAPKADGKSLYYTYCAVCHKTGLNAAPKYGNKALWIKRIAQGRDLMYKHAIEGLRGMPPRGGIPGLSDEEVKAAVDFMVKGSGGWGDS